MEFTKLCSPSLKDLFIEQLEHLILSGRLKIGEKLPSERELAEAMQVSRAVVNGGIADLERKGFLIVKPRIGTFVADYRRNGTLDTLIAIMNYNGGKLRKEEIRSILEIRIALDSLAAKLTIERITDEQIHLLYKKTEKIINAGSIEEACNAAFEFQHELALLSGNTLIPLMFHSFKIPVLTLWERFCTLYGIPALYENTYQLWLYIKNHDTDGAIHWIETFLNESIDGERSIYY
ncbi:FadR/GntR family transcriptional regulator [Velocimicrobium porci]|uniref:FadR family transcriptional regulator n=1 Tax=Velocimicrobium porci TaxID=2606634 RepID=A0A6L5Y2A4_9FIRM|nr:GntR family transcriptional regulator [Velocimicrobium porci]MSS64997.1 FadR family transcriptional regulator [Velocimicrobium porci]